MATASVIPGMAGGMATGAKNVGMPVAGNALGLNQFSPIPSGNTQPPPQLGGAGTTGVPPAGPGMGSAIPQGINTPMGTSPTAINTPPQSQSGSINPTATTLPTPTSTSSTDADGNPNATVTAQQNKQLTDIYGQGTGSLLGGLIGNLGSNDSSYMQAYNTAMAGQTAQGLSTIGTSLGNAGVSANSSTSAIEKGSYLAQTSAAAGQQEQQLIQNQTQDEIGLVQGIQGASASETATNWLTTAGQVADVAGSFISDAMLMPQGGGSSAPASFPGQSSQPQQLPNVFGGAPSTPSSIPGTGAAPISGLDF
jgi:hypothetical protein